MTFCLTEGPRGDMGHWEKWVLTFVDSAFAEYLGLGLPLSYLSLRTLNIHLNNFSGTYYVGKISRCHI